MGTSSSSNGSPSNVPMVPPWVPDLPSTPPESPESEPPEEILPAQSQNSEQPPASDEPTEGEVDLAASEADHSEDVDGKVRIAPEGRFQSARTNLTSFARNSDRDAMRRGLRYYVSHGYGGSKTATARMGGTVRSSEALLSALSGPSGNPLQAPGAALDPALLAGQSADDVMDAVTDALRPIDGTQDAESNRTAIREALSETLEKFPDADLLNLTQEQKELALEVFVAEDIYGRFSLDLGTQVIKQSPSTASGLSRLREIRDYIRETVAGAFRKLKSLGRTLSKSRVSSVVRNAIQETFSVFEGYTR